MSAYHDILYLIFFKQKLVLSYSIIIGLIDGNVHVFRVPINYYCWCYRHEAKYKIL